LTKFPIGTSKLALVHALIPIARNNHSSIHKYYLL
jgi:hypothetical protein